jgi:hypothetical protein
MLVLCLTSSVWRSADPCAKKHCGAGRVCELTEEGEAECVCISACPEEVDPRRKVQTKTLLNVHLFFSCLLTPYCGVSPIIKLGSAYQLLLMGNIITGKGKGHSMMYPCRHRGEAGGMAQIHFQPQHWKGVGSEQGAQVALPPEIGTVPTVQTAGWASGPVWTGTENLACHWG